ncbi:MAG: hypothetical protein P1P84_12770 [Deferrisomatales bacterium]|nr:hypothetical protein [Deferrisomatales bacterium]
MYQDMAVEEVVLEVFPSTPSWAEPVALGRSGYHGSFALRLAPGTYRVTARGTLPGPGGIDRTLVASQELVVPPGARRIDRWVVNLRQAPAP